MKRCFAPTPSAGSLPDGTLEPLPGLVDLDRMRDMGDADLVESLFPVFDVWSSERLSLEDGGIYGPQGQAVLKHLKRARTLTWPQMERVRGWARRDIDIETATAQARAGIARAIAETGREASVRQAFLDGQEAIFDAHNPTFGELEYWDYGPRDDEQWSGYAAAALVVADHLDPAVLESIMLPWRTLGPGYPLGYFGPRTVEVEALLEATTHLTFEQCDRIVGTWAWARPHLAELARWRMAVAPPEHELRLSVSKALELVNKEIQIERHLAVALGEVIRRRRIPIERLGQRFHLYWAGHRDAIQAAVAALVVGDQLDPAAVTALGEAWAARDTAVPPE